MRNEDLDLVVKRIIEDNIESIENDDFNKALGDALKNGVEDEFVDTFYRAGVSIPVNQVYDALKKHYKGECLRLPIEEREKRICKLTYLINKNQLAAFRGFIRG